MGFDQYHEPPDELPAETRTFARLCASLTEEAEAIGWYEQRIAVESDHEALAIMRDAQGEEFKHFSMDYQVFLVSRMHEEWMRTGDSPHSVRIGQAATGRVITAAATIMILVFGSFLLAGQRVIAEFGVGLASAVFLDAFILRTILVPAVMHLIGERNWWLPRGLDRALPRVAVEAAET